VTRLKSPAEGGLSRYPLKDIQLHSLEVQIPVDGRLSSPPYPEGEVFYLVTFEGKLASQEELLRMVLIIA
jgi:hypothetical protein